MIIQLCQKSNTKSFPDTHDIFLTKNSKKLVKRIEALKEELILLKENPTTVSESDTSYYQNLITSTRNKLTSYNTDLSNSTIAKNGTTLVVNSVVVHSYSPPSISSLRIHIPWFYDSSNNSYLTTIASSDDYPNDDDYSRASLLVPLDSKQHLTVLKLDSSYTMTRDIPEYFQVTVTDGFGRRLTSSQLENISEIQLHLEWR